MSQELHYTSAPRGLWPGSQGYCTVACTTEMPRGLAERLESLSAYRNLFPPHDPRAAENPVVFSHLKVTVAGAPTHVVSQVGFAGLDYTNRANKYAHHVVLDASELPRGGPAWLLSQPGFLRESWDGRVGLIEERLRVPQGDDPPRVCQGWQAATGDAGWAGVLAESFLSGAKSVAYLIFEPGTDLLPLIREAVALLPPERRWDLTFSTYFTSLPQGAVCAWRGVVRGSPEEVQARKAPQALVVDIDRSLGKPKTDQLVEQARTGRVTAAATLAGGAPSGVSPLPPLLPAQSSGPLPLEPVPAGDTYAVLPPLPPTRAPRKPPRTVNRTTSVSPHRARMMVVAACLLLFMLAGALGVVAWQAGIVRGRKRPQPATSLMLAQHSEGEPGVVDESGAAKPQPEPASEPKRQDAAAPLTAKSEPREGVSGNLHVQVPKPREEAPAAAANPKNVDPLPAESATPKTKLDAEGSKTHIPVLTGPLIECVSLPRMNSFIKEKDLVRDIDATHHHKLVVVGLDDKDYKSLRLHQSGDGASKEGPLAVYTSNDGKDTPLGKFWIAGQTVRFAWDDKLTANPGLNANDSFSPHTHALRSCILQVLPSNGPGGAAERRVLLRERAKGKPDGPLSFTPQGRDRVIDWHTYGMPVTRPLRLGTCRSGRDDILPADEQNHSPQERVFVVPGPVEVRIVLKLKHSSKDDHLSIKIVDPDPELAMKAIRSIAEQWPPRSLDKRVLPKPILPSDDIPKTTNKIKATQHIEDLIRRSDKAYRSLRKLASEKNSPETLNGLEGALHDLRDCADQVVKIAPDKEWYDPQRKKIDEVDEQLNLLRAIHRVTSNSSYSFNVAIETDIGDMRVEVARIGDAQNGPKGGRAGSAQGRDGK